MTVEHFQALFREHKKERVIDLLCGFVYRITERERGAIALMHDIERGTSFKFWLIKAEQPMGARRMLIFHEGRPLPVISREKSNFDVEIGDIVLFARPKKKSAAFPVVSLSEYRRISSEIKRRSSATKGVAIDPLGIKRRDHRWVEAPPLVATPRTNIDRHHT